MGRGNISVAPILVILFLPKASTATRIFTFGKSLSSFFSVLSLVFLFLAVDLIKVYRMLVTNKENL